MWRLAVSYIVGSRLDSSIDVFILPPTYVLKTLNDANNSAIGFSFCHILWRFVVFAQLYKQPLYTFKQCGSISPYLGDLFA